MGNRKTCFVISPIGAEGSDVRQRANDFLELLVEPALQRFDFEVIRADKIQKPTAITGDIIRLVQESDMCLIDLTDSNPNVFYECGRRHETGRPFIQLVENKSLASLPFDVSGIRTVPYDLSSPRQVLKSVQDLQSYIQVFVDAGIETGNTGESLSSLAQAIERVERKLNLLTAGGGAIGPNTANLGKGSIEDLLVQPHEAFRKALTEGDLDRAFRAAQRYGPKRDKEEYAAMMAILAGVGLEKAYQVLDNLLLEEITKENAIDLSSNIVTATIAGIKRYFEASGEFEQGVQYIRDAISRIQTINGDTKNLAAMMYNQIGMMNWLQDQIEECITATQRAVELDPTEGSYFYNLGLAYERIGDESGLVFALKKLKALNTDDEDHLNLINRHGL